MTAVYIKTWKERRLEGCSIERAMLDHIADLEAALRNAPKPAPMGEAVRIEGEPEESFYRRVVYANGWNACLEAMSGALPAQAEQVAAVRAAYEKAAMVCQNMYEDGEGGAGCAVAADRIRALATKEAAAVEAPSQDQADAARYRWLRDYPWSFELPELAQIIQLQSNALWDSAIDAAMSGEQSPQSDMGGE
jgi:hypothetical protein